MLGRGCEDCGEVGKLVVDTSLNLKFIRVVLGMEKKFFYVDEDLNKISKLPSGNWNPEIGKYIEIGYNEYVNSYICSKCWKRFNTQRATFQHSKRCKIIKNDFTLINKKSPLNLRRLCNFMGLISRIEQRLDFAATSDSKFKDTEKMKNANTLLYATNNKLLGFITFVCRRFKNNRDWKLSVDDFFVAFYKRNQGIGNKIFNEMLRIIDKNEANITYNSPSEDFISFLRNRLSKEDFEKLEFW